jgi:hypothetical protein
MIFNFNDEINEKRMRYELRLNNLDEVNINHYLQRTKSDKVIENLSNEEKELIFEEQLQYFLKVMDTAPIMMLSKDMSEGSYEIKNKWLLPDGYMMRIPLWYKVSEQV